MKKSILAIMAICTASGGWAGSLGNTVEEPSVHTPAASHDWGGPYLGLSFGIPAGDNSWELRPSGETDADSWNGTVGGLAAGIDRQSGSLVYGASLHVMGGSIDASSETSPTFGCGGVTCDTEVSSLYALRGRIGKAMGSNLFYATAGYASGKAEASATGFGVLGSDRLSGWVAGFGIEHAINDRFTIGADYTHTDLGRLEIPTTCFPQCYTDVSFGLVTLGANYNW